MKNSFALIDIIGELIILIVSIALVSIFSVIFVKPRSVAKKYALISFLYSLLLTLFLIHSGTKFNIHFLICFLVCVILSFGNMYWFLKNDIKLKRIIIGFIIQTLIVVLCVYFLSGILFVLWYYNGVI